VDALAAVGGSFETTFANEWQKGSLQRRRAIRRRHSWRGDHGDQLDTALPRDGQY
jgi:hypothetical protein